MKTFINLCGIPILCIFLMASCSKEKGDNYWPLGNYWKGNQKYGVVYALRNGEFWEASGAAYTNKYFPTITLDFNTFDPVDSVDREHIGFIKLPFKEERFEIHDSFTDTIGGLYVQGYDDEIDAIFDIDSTKVNWVQIESIDTANLIVKGKFDVNFHIGALYENTKFPRDVYFSQGTFQVKIAN